MTVHILLFVFATVGSTVGSRISLICTVGRDSGFTVVIFPLRVLDMGRGSEWDHGAGTI